MDKNLKNAYDALVIERAKQYKAHDDANPDVGMPPFFGYFIQMAESNLKSEGIIPNDYTYNS